jgi:hypothetical protein
MGLNIERAQKLQSKLTETSLAAQTRATETFKFLVANSDKMKMYLISSLDL